MEKKLIEDFRPYIIDDGSELYVKAKIAPKFIAACNDYEVAVIGIEGFFIDSKGIFQPQIDMIEDFSEMKSHDWTEFKLRCNQMALKLINEIISTHDPKSLVFNFVLDNREDYNGLHSGAV